MAQPDDHAGRAAAAPPCPFADRPGLVTGAASGIGRAVALRLATLGAPVTMIDQDEAGLAETGAAIAQLGGRSVAVCGDIRDIAVHQDAVGRTLEAFGSLRLAANVAGWSGPAGGAADIAPEQWAAMIDVNLSGCFYGLHSQIPAMLASGGGAIVVVTSMYADRGQRSRPAYAAAKHGLRGLTRSVVNDYAVRGIRCNEVQPGVIRTPMIQGDLARAEALASQIPQQRLGTPDDVAAAVTFLLSDDAAYINGAHLAVDGGLLC